MNPFSHFTATNPPTSSISDNQRIIRDYTGLKTYLDILGDKSLTFYQFAGEYKRYHDSLARSYKMPTREEFGYALLRLVQERLLVMS